MDAAFQMFSVESKLFEESRRDAILLDGGKCIFGPHAMELNMSSDGFLMAVSESIEKVELLVLLRQVGCMSALDALDSGKTILHALKCIEPLLIFLGSCRR